ncbi:MAG: peptidoglycan DD-metalloendopeptidase family protein [Amphritea sp.]|nr:peptidoglycan DD-metalloendopeptidase family protein [Amphritea sp.]
MVRTSGLIFSVTVLLLLTACSSSSIYTPVDERSIGGKKPVRVVSSNSPRPDRYTVRRGDTLYAIAFRYGLDYRQLARNNNINGRYEIYPGQKLDLKPRKAPPPAARPASSSPQKAASQKTAQSQAATPARKPASAPAKKPAASKKPVATVAANRVLKWRWPGKGQILQGFSSSGKVNKGINIAGKRGDPVYAAESGKVVYAGSGLLGYGNLVIINHNQQFLSAYAHNSRILVKESDMVKVGDKIAEIGSSGTTRDMLHFEIRRDGQPVNPMKYLPRNR